MHPTDASPTNHGSFRGGDPICPPKMAATAAMALLALAYLPNAANHSILAMISTALSSIAGGILSLPSPLKGQWYSFPPILF